MSTNKDKERRAPDYEPQAVALAEAEADGRLPESDRRLDADTEPSPIVLPPREIDTLDVNVEPDPFHTPSGDPEVDKKLFITHIRWLLLKIRPREGELVAEIDYWLEHLDDMDLIVAPPARNAERKLETSKKE